MTEDERYMKEAIRQARKAEALDEVPIGCVIVYEWQNYCHGDITRRNTDKNTLCPCRIKCHPKSQQENWGTGVWKGCTMYITLEPCQMCAGAIVQAKSEQGLSLEAANPKAGCAGFSAQPACRCAEFNHQVERGQKACWTEECSNYAV